MLLLLSACGNVTGGANSSTSTINAVAAVDTADESVEITITP